MTLTFAQPPVVEVLYLAVLALPLIWVSLTDLADFVIPDLAVISVALWGLVYPMLNGVWPDLASILLAIGIMAILTLIGEVYWRRKGVEALGLGDVKLIGAGILVVGADMFWLMVLIAASGGIATALLARRRAEKGIPFGPFLAYAIFSIRALATQG